MRVFVTGASGWIGSAAVDELLARGHEVVGAARSDASAARLERQGATVRRTDLDDLDGLRAGALEADAVIHLANKHDWSNPAESARAERAAVETFTAALAGSGKPFLLAAGVAGLAQGRPSTEADRTDARGPQAPRGGTENLALDAVPQVASVSLRFAPTVHGEGDHGFIAEIARAARERGFAGYIGDGTNEWAAVHRSDAGRAVALGLDGAPAGTALHVVAERGVSTRSIAEAIGRGLGVPVRSVAAEDAERAFGWISRFWGLDMRAESADTHRLLGWTPTGPTLRDDLEAGRYTR
ncbi:NAD-dependent epimerase/dehydratase family protein [uncultured Amnibacterium sp.]|uniref:NAD-dependent epimerase/dehydratase family protein n=1 Tax=uncultured Amnibacterium sp. TaxID=1631851 RepID=UPI0035CC9F22